MRSEQPRRCLTSFNRGAAESTEKHGTRYVFRYSSLCRVTESLYKLLRLLEHRAGIEPANTGFADQRVSHFAIGALCSAALRGGVQLKQITLLRLRRRAKVRLHRLVARK